MRSFTTAQLDAIFRAAPAAPRLAQEAERRHVGCLSRYQPERRTPADPAGIDGASKGTLPARVRSGDSMDVGDQTSSDELARTADRTAAKVAAAAADEPSGVRSVRSAEDTTGAEVVRNADPTNIGFIPSELEVTGGAASCGMGL